MTGNYAPNFSPPPVQQGGGPGFLGPPVHPNSGPGFLGPPVNWGFGGPRYLGPPVRPPEGQIHPLVYLLHGLLSHYIGKQGG